MKHEVVQNNVTKASHPLPFMLFTIKGSLPLICIDKGEENVGRRKDGEAIADGAVNTWVTHLVQNIGNSGCVVGLQFLGVGVMFLGCIFLGFAA